jgi:hypothetical protein
VKTYPKQSLRDPINKLSSSLALSHSVFLSSLSQPARARVRVFQFFLFLFWGVLATKNGEPYGPSGEEHKGDEPAELGRENPAVEDLPEHILEGAVLRAHRGDPRRQGHGAGPLRRHPRRQPKAHALHVPRYEDAPDSAREGDRHRVHQERRLQVPLSLHICVRVLCWSYCLVAVKPEEEDGRGKSLELREFLLSLSRENLKKKKKEKRKDYFVFNFALW